MFKSFIIAGFALLIFFTTPTPAQDWKRYIPQSQRREVYKKASLSTGLTAKFISKVNARVLWVTDEVARAIVSDMLDKKYISAKDADSEYFDIRPFNHFLFYLFIKVDKKTPWGPLDQQAFSLYKENDQKNRLSSGEVKEASFKEGLREALDLEFEVKEPRRKRRGIARVHSNNLN